MFAEVIMQSGKVFHFLIVGEERVMISIDSGWWNIISLGVTSSRILISS